LALLYSLDRRRTARWISLLESDFRKRWYLCLQRIYNISRNSPYPSAPPIPGQLRINTQRQEIERFLGISTESAVVSIKQGRLPSIPQGYTLSRTPAQLSAIYISHRTIHDLSRYTQICSTDLGRRFNITAPISLNVSMAWCDPCDRYFVSEYALQQHLDNAAAHRPVYYCENCMQYFSSAQGLEHHQENSIKHLKKVWNYVCEPCSWGCDQLKAMEDHDEKFHYWCKMHNRFFDNENNLRQVRQSWYLNSPSY